MLAVIVFVATGDCVRSELLPGFGPFGHRGLHRRHERKAERLRRSPASPPP